MSAPRATFARLALAAAALTLVVVVASAWMRHERAGLACAHWPACYGSLASLIDAPPSPGERAARVVHRIAATGVALLVAALAFLSWRHPGLDRTARRLASGAAVVVVALSALGVVTTDARVPAVPLANLLGGCALLALLVCARVAALRSPSSGVRKASGTALQVLIGSVLVVAFVQVALGGLIGAQFALVPCTGGQACASAGVEAWMPTRSLDVLRAWPVVDGRIVAPRDAEGLHAAHRIVGMVLFAGVLTIAALLPRTARRRSALLVALALLAPVAGGATLHALPSVPLTVVHNAIGALLVAAIAVTLPKSS